MMARKWIRFLNHSVFCAIWIVTVNEPAFPDDKTSYPAGVQTILEQTRPLTHARGNRLPLLLWPAHGAVIDGEINQKHIIRELDARGVAVIATWVPSEKEKSLANSMRVARIQQELWASWSP